MTEIKLLPCPFCGSTNVAQGASRGSISVWCFCGSQGPSVPFPDECIDPVVPILKCHEAWNRRSTFSDAVAEREAEPVAPTSELEALRKRVAEIDAHRRKVLAENECLLNALIERVRRVAELEGAMDPFAWVAEHDIGESEADDDLFRPMERHNRAPRLTVGHLRTARRVREGGKVE